MTENLNSGLERASEEFQTADWFGIILDVLLVKHFLPQLYAQQSERGIKYPKSSKHIQRLYRKKQNAVKDYLHKVTRWIAEYCRKEDICCVVVGDIRNIHRGKDLGHKTNQKYQKDMRRPAERSLIFRSPARLVLL